MKEKNIIERTKEMRILAKKLKKLEEEVLLPVRLATNNLMSFIELPRSVRFVQDYYSNYEMLQNINQKVISPSQFCTDGNELKYILWISKQIDKSKQFAEKYNNVRNKIYRCMFDFIIIEDEEARREIKDILKNCTDNFQELENDKITEIIYKSNNIRSNAITEFYKNQGKGNEYKYMDMVVNETIKEFPEILDENISEAYTPADKFHELFNSDFGEIEMELLYYES